MIHIKGQNYAINDIGTIYNWNIASNFDEKEECLINFKLTYSNSPTIKVEPQDKCSVIDITLTGFKIKRKNKQVKEIEINPEAIIIEEEHCYFSEDSHEQHKIMALYLDEEYEIRIRKNNNIKVCGKLKNIIDKVGGK